jgi:5-bromo-4-chloroindolyl phosphate hydrolysis protein
MERVKENLAKLIKVKTIVTLVVIGVFSVLALKGKIDAENVMLIVTSVISFYFGTQHEKKQENT